MSNNDLDSQIDDLNNELVWSQIIRKEKELAKAKKVVAMSQEHLDESNREIQGAHVSSAYGSERMTLIMVLTPLIDI
jgi:chromosome segregation ATPase